jgi:hypothetical protein
MRPIQNAGGHVGLTARNYPIAAAAAISAGEVVQLSGGLVIAAVASQTGPILGIAAENHPGVADALNVRANGTEILVYDNPELIFECPAPTFKASGGTATTVTAAAADVAMATADAFNGGYLVSPKGNKRAVTDFASANSVATFTVPSGETPAADDEYTLYPPIGCAAGWRLDADTLSKIVLSATGCTKLKVVGHDFDRGMVRLMAVEHSLGVES